MGVAGDIYPCHWFNYLNKEDGSNFKIGNITTGVDTDKLTSFTRLKTTELASERRLSDYSFVQELIEDNSYGQV